MSGKVENAPPNATHTQLLLESRDNGERTSGGVKPDGSFYLWRLYPGDYELQAIWQLPDGSTIRSAPADFHIEGSNNIENLRLHPAAPMTVTGRVIFDDEAARPVHGAVTKIVLLDAGIHTSAVTADITPDGAFEIPNVPPGRYRPTLTWSGAYADAPLLDLTTPPPGRSHDPRQFRRRFHRRNNRARRRRHPDPRRSRLAAPRDGRQSQRRLFFP